jgi:hypothetical protein
VGAGVAAGVAVVFFLLFLVFFTCDFLVVSVAVLSVVGAWLAAKAVPRIIAAPSIKAESFFMVFNFPFLGEAFALIS